MPTGTKLNAPNAVIGLCVMGLGVALALDRLGIVPAEQVLQYWPIGLVLLGASMVFQSIRGGPDSARGTFPIGAAIWLVLIGLFLTHVFDRRGSAAHGDHSDHVRLFALLSGDNRRVDTTFRGADITALMGGVKLDLREAHVSPGEEVVVDVFSMMGGAELYVPRDWIVDIRASAVMGGIKDSRNRPFEGRRGRGEDDPLPATPPPIAPVPPVPPVLSVEPDSTVERADDALRPGQPPRLVVRGFVMMGGLDIKP